MTNVMIFAETMEEVQGIIRGIEQLDSDHKICIIHGAPCSDRFVGETNIILAEVANAVVITADYMKVAPHPRNIPTQVYKVTLDDSIIQKANRRHSEGIDYSEDSLVKEVIDSIVNNYPSIVEELTNITPATTTQK